MLKTLSFFAACHSFAASAIGSLARALSGFVLKMFVWFANATSCFVCLLGSRKSHVFCLARIFTIGRVVFFAFIGGIYSLTKAFDGEPKE